MDRFFRIAAVVASFAVPTVLEGDGGSSSKDNCHFDVKKVDPSSTCLRSTWCGGSHGGAITYGGLKVTSPGGGGGGSVDCCLTELVVPEHTEIIAGNKRIVHLGDVDAVLIMRRCSSPFVLLWIEFGSWTCEVDTILPFGKYSLDSAQACD